MNSSVNKTRGGPSPSAQPQKSKGAPGSQQIKKVNNNSGKVNSTEPRQQTQSTQQKPQKNKNNKESATQRTRITFLFLNLVGQLVQVQVHNGDVYEGIFSAVNFEENDSYSVAIKLARNIKKKGVDTTNDYIFGGKDIVQIHAVAVAFANEKERYRNESFMTDTEISRKEFRERELVPWKPSAVDAGVSIDDVDLNNGPRNWDQFAVNKEKFGVQTTWDESQYTTDLDRNSDFYKANASKAAQIALEIERGAANGNVHLMEERGHDTSNYTEEELYSSVLTQQQASREGKYVPPHAPQQQPPKSTSPITVPLTKPISLQDINQNLEQASANKNNNSAFTLAPSTSSSSSDNTTSENISKPPRPQLDISTRNARTSTNNSKVSTPVESPIDSISKNSLIRDRLRIRGGIGIGNRTNSPHGLNSPTMLASPLALSPSSPLVKGLALDPALPKVSDQLADELFNFKLNQSSGDSKSRNFELDSFRKFSKDMNVKVKSTQIEDANNVTNSATNAPAPTTPTPSILSMARRMKGKAAANADASSSATAKQPTRETEMTSDPNIHISTDKHAPHTPTPTVSTPSVSNNTTLEPTQAITPPSSTAPATTATATSAEKPKKSTLNPNAKSFVFNPKAKSFVPPAKKQTPPISEPPPSPPQQQQHFVPAPMYGPGPYPMYPMPFGMPYPMAPIPHHMGPPGIPVIHPGAGTSFHDKAGFSLPQNVDTSVSISEIYQKGITSQKNDPKMVPFVWPGGHQTSSYKDLVNHGQQELPQMGHPQGGFPGYLVGYQHPY
ncbi:ataxin-2 [Acrasis kona]|uniref:Ataxin-2 n=1 Tax=Acrasis kona TaxID=1008807 RepID=A0AAW2YVS1_9EUKA